MIVQCLSFGSLWWIRPGSDPSDQLRYSARAAIFNTCGFRTGNRERRFWIVPGIIRWNAGALRNVGGWMPKFSGLSFSSPGIEKVGGWNRLFLERQSPTELAVDFWLLAHHSEVLGPISFDTEWRSKGVRILASSGFRGRQESLLLLPPGGWFETDSGKWGVYGTELQPLSIAKPHRLEG